MTNDRNAVSQVSHVSQGVLSSLETGAEWNLLYPTALMCRSVVELDDVYLTKVTVWQQFSNSPIGKVVESGN